MVQDNKKIITVSFVFAGILLGFTVHLLMELLASYSTAFARIGADATLSNGIPVAIGAVVFLILQLNAKTVGYMDNVVGELKKVVWPSRKDTGLMTVVVVIMLLISGVVVGLYDAIWAYVINYFLK